MGSEFMRTAISHGRTLRATLCEVERGVFYAAYPGCESASDADELTTYEVGSGSADAKFRIEQQARTLGYDTILWSETIVVPLFASNAKPVLHEPAAT
jgi:hypothetical protein